MRVFWTLLVKEVMRSFAIPIQTLLTPIISTFLYVVIFGVAMGRRLSFPYEVDYLTFMVSGLIIMNVFQQAFQGITSSIIISKYRMNIVDLMTYPLAQHWIVLAHGVGGMVRGWFVGISLWLVAIFFMKGMAVSPAVFLLSSAVGGLLFSLMGTWVALRCKSFDQVALFSNFVILPVLFLSGVFFPAVLFPEPWRTLSLYNPIVYVVDIARYGLIGVTPGNPILVCLAVLSGILLFWGLGTFQMRRGIKLR